jgi:hypothetical protein
LITLVIEYVIIKKGIKIPFLHYFNNFDINQILQNCNNDPIEIEIKLKGISVNVEVALNIAIKIIEKILLTISTKEPIKSNPAIFFKILFLKK